MPAGIQLKGERAAILLAGGVIVLAGIAAYATSFAGVMVYDDIPSIVQNASIRHLWPGGDVPASPVLGALTTSGRPVLQASFALNYAISGTGVWSYHALNLLIHLLAGLALFGIVRRSLREGGALPRVGFACAVALLWTVHPLQTEAVTYVVQRAESLMGLFYLLTLYGFIRFAGATGAARTAWGAATVAACLLGMGTKEVMATAPVMVFLYDRTFLAGTFAEAWRRRRGFYAALAATWVPLGLLVASTGGNRGGSVGFGVAVTWWAYGLTQFQAVARYLGLSLWPHPLVFEYGMFWVRGAGEVLPYAVPVLVLLGATVWLLFRPPGASAARWDAGRRLGFLGAWFFGILAPSSLMPGTTQMIVEHRMYLSLAAAMALLVLGIHRLLPSARRALPVCLALALAFGAATVRRNQTYGSTAALWGDTIAKRPDNVVAYFNLGDEWIKEGKVRAGLALFERAVQLRPDLAVTHFNRAGELYQTGQPAAAGAEYAAALRLNPDYAEAHDGWGIALAALGRPDEAIAQYREALRLRPDFAQAHDNLGNALLQAGRLPDAAGEYGEAVRIDPGSALAQTNLGNALLQLGRVPEAVAHLQAAVRRDPGLVEAHAKLGDGWMESNRPEDAIAEYEEALRLNPAYVQAQNNLGIALAATGRPGDAVAHYEEALRLDPDLADAHFNLANSLFRLGRPDEAAAHYEAVLRLRPDDAVARARLDLARRAAATGRRP
jgi:tetratricopeptide (TPR) repeat protein